MTVALRNGFVYNRRRAVTNLADTPLMNDMQVPTIDILTFRGKKVILDSDLARAYNVPTRQLNQQVKRNPERFPEDFCFQLTREEKENLRSPFATSSQIDQQITGQTGMENLMSQNVTSSSAENYGGRRKLPNVFTEHGVIMAASVLKSSQAVSVSVYIARMFVQMRENLMTNADILKRLAEIDKTLLEHDDALRVVWSKLQPLLQPPPDPPRKKIGFNVLPDQS